MNIHYFAKVVNMQSVEVAIAQNAEEAKALRAQSYEPCSRAFYESILRGNQKPATTK